MKKTIIPLCLLLLCTVFLHKNISLPHSPDSTWEEKQEMLDEFVKLQEELYNAQGMSVEDKIEKWIHFRDTYPNSNYLACYASQNAASLSVGLESPDFAKVLEYDQWVLDHYIGLEDFLEELCASPEDDWFHYQDIYPENSYMYKKEEIKHRQTGRYIRSLLAKAVFLFRLSYYEESREQFRYLMEKNLNVLVVNCPQWALLSMQEYEIANTYCRSNYHHCRLDISSKPYRCGYYSVGCTSFPEFFEIMIYLNEKMLELEEK